MPIIMHYTPNYKQEEEIYKRFKTGYSIFKNKENCNKATLDVAKIFAYDAFKIDSEVRTKIFPDLNGMLVEMVKDDFLMIKKKDISLLDPVTSDLCCKELFKNLKFS